MAAHFHRSILTPEQSVFEGEVEYVEAPGSEGYFGVLAHHAALVTSLGEGQLKVRYADGKEERWPPLDQLRPGAEVNGWIMLDTVSLGFELWRQFNAFPPTVKREPIGEKSKQMGDSKDKKEDKKSSDDK